jgi:hypothetical protein
MDFRTASSALHHHHRRCRTRFISRHRHQNITMSPFRILPIRRAIFHRLLIRRAIFRLHRLQMERSTMIRARYSTTMARRWTRVLMRIRLASIHTDRGRMAAHHPRVDRNSSAALRPSEDRNPSATHRRKTGRRRFPGHRTHRGQPAALLTCRPCPIRRRIPMAHPPQIRMARQPCSIRMARRRPRCHRLRPDGLFGLDLLPVYACVAWDTWRHRRLHPAFVIGALLLAALDLPFIWIFLSTSAWTHFATRLLSWVA